jgi:hypothetical protein
MSQFLSVCPALYHVSSLLSTSPSQFCVCLSFCQCALLCQQFTTIMFLPLYHVSSLNKRPRFLLYMPHTFKSFYAYVVLSTTLLRPLLSPSPSYCYKTVCYRAYKCSNCTSCFLSMTSITISCMHHYFYVASFLPHYRSHCHTLSYILLVF